MTLTLADIFDAQRTVAGVASDTPLVPSPYLSEMCGQEFLLKLENMQPIGAFKLRGAMNAVAKLPDDAKGVVCCSTGNHGRGVAYAARLRGLPAVVCMSALVPEAKVEGIRALGADIRIVGNSQSDALAEARRLCEAEGLVNISPFDDPFVIAGQGTIGIELLAARPDLDMILVPLSGGGLAGGIALAAKTIKPDIRVIGISMDRGAAMHESLRAGHPVEVTEVVSLADSLGGEIGLDNKLSFGLCRDHLDDTVLVSEDEIYAAMQALYYEDRIVAEGGSVVGIAALRAGKLPKPKGPVAAVVTGRNLDMALFTAVVNGEAVRLGDMTVEGKSHVP